MPINNKWPIDDIIKEGNIYTKNSKASIMYEYVLFKNINDSDNDAARLAKLLSNSDSKLNIIPNQIITKEPSAELKFNQTDRDSLPPYKVLDQILEMLIDQNKDIESIVKSGFNKRIINRVWKMIKNSEFKRYQSAVGPKISKLSLSVDRRFPLTNKFELQ